VSQSCAGNEDDVSDGDDDVFPIPDDVFGSAGRQSTAAALTGENCLDITS